MALVRTLVGDRMKEIKLGLTYKSRRKTQAWQEKLNKKQKKENDLRHVKTKGICRRPLETGQSEDGFYGFGKEGRQKQGKTKTKNEKTYIWATKAKQEESVLWHRLSNPKTHSFSNSKNILP